MKNSIFKEKEFSRVDNLVSKVTRLLNKKRRLILDEFNLTCSQFEILRAIDYFSQNNNEVIQINLSEKTQIDPMTTSSVLRNLQKRGLIQRERGIINTRTVEVQITKSGYEIYILAQKKIVEMQEGIYKNVDYQGFANQLLLLSDKLNTVNN